MKLFVHLFMAATQKKSTVNKQLGAEELEFENNYTADT